MCDDKIIHHGFRLRVLGKSEPTIFYWPLLPDNIVDLQFKYSGGTDVTIKLPNNKTVTHAVVESKEEIEAQMSKCRKMDEEEKKKLEEIKAKRK